jgi:hypothetical protein
MLCRPVCFLSYSFETSKLTIEIRTNYIPEHEKIHTVLIEVVN